MTNLDDYLTTSELAKKLNRAPETLTRWRRMRVGPPYVRLQGRVLYEPKKVAAWIDAQTVEQAVA